MFNTDFEPHLGSYDMRIDTSEMPAGLARKLNSSICMKGGGGGGGTTPTSSIPDEWKPFVTNSLTAAEKDYQSGDFSKVAGLAQDQLAGLDKSRSLTSGAGNAFDKAAGEASGGLGALGNAARGEGPLFGASNLGAQKSELLRQAQGQLGQNDAAFGGAGSAGSARQARAQGQTEAGLAGSLAQLDQGDLDKRRQASIQGAQGTLTGAGNAQKAALAGSKELQKSGAVYQTQQQKDDDAKYQGLNRLFGLYSGAQFQSQGNVQKSGGK